MRILILILVVVCTFLIGCDQNHVDTYQAHDSVFVYPTDNQIAQCVKVVKNDK